ncbi:ATP-binding cassette domain-containing protein [Nesterenkonia pannonica]|uniref:ATP-binding cassette domain-containing protein n=1 Tax=Nesterenkonia pannonica TaxID=1548602 RepID=UPI0021647FB5|nr:ATP-binding cassette domain-containing protein [Nesterenkonia pannonica]
MHHDFATPCVDCLRGSRQGARPGGAGRQPEIPRGSIQGIIGFSGAGKSTLLRNINLLERPTEGEVWVGGTELTGLKDEQLRQARHQIGMVFQGFNLVNNLTVAQNVELSLKFAYQKDKKQRRRRAAEALEIVDISPRRRTTPPSSPAARSSGWPSPARWPPSRTCCCAMSPPAPWTPSPPPPCCSTSLT